MIPIDEAHLQVSAHSDAGLKGKKNEDRYRVSAFQHGLVHPVPSLLVVVADGVGEHHAGEVAAQIAVDTVTQFVGQSDASQPSHILHAGILRASQSILVQAELDSRKQGMGSTCLAVWVIGDRLYTAYVGNSRLYLLRDRRLRQLSIDHVLVRDEEDQNGLRRRRRSENGYRHFLGSRDPVRVDLRLAAHPGDERPSAERNQGFRLGINDRLLLCTDGLTDVLEVTEITEVMLDAPLDVAASKLVQLALGRGAPDNLTAVAIGFPKGQPYKGRAISNWKRLALILLLALILGVVAWVRWPTLGEDFTKPLTPEATAITTNTPLPTHTSTVLPE